MRYIPRPGRMGAGVSILRGTVFPTTNGTDTGVRGAHEQDRRYQRVR
jgi:hypothetical protein